MYNFKTIKINFFLVLLILISNYHFQPIVEEIPSHVKDKRDFIQKLNQIEAVPEDSLQFLDIKPLYNNIPNNE